MIERVASGIPGLDKHMQGGFIKDSVNLISGATGTGKSIFGLQYIWHGLQKKENGVFMGPSLQRDDQAFLHWIELWLKRAPESTLSPHDRQEISSFIRSKQDAITCHR